LANISLPKKDLSFFEQGELEGVLQTLNLFKPLASLGIGSARVDTNLAENQFQAGDTVRGTVWIRGGQTTQQIEDIYLYLVITLLKQNKKTKHVLSKFKLSHAFLIQPGEVKEIPFQIQLPLYTPMSTGGYPIHLKTDVEIKMAVDPTDEDKIEVFPHPLVQKLLKQIEDAEFILYQIYNVYDKEQKPHSFAQVYCFRPTGRYHGYIDELNVSFNMTQTHIQMDLEMIRSSQSFFTSLKWEYNNPDSVLYINDQQTMSDPLNKIKEILNRKAF
jgi:sporulation-control protein